MMQKEVEREELTRIQLANINKIDVHLMLHTRYYLDSTNILAI